MIYLLIPARNERQNLPRLLESWRTISAELRQPIRFVIIDDASTDDTASFLKSSGDDVEVHSLFPNRGPGGAFAHGLNILVPIAKEDDIIFTLEADNTSDTKIAEKMLQALSDGHDLVLAACYAEGGGIVGTTPLRIFLSSIANFIMKLIFRFPAITTYTSFYRAWNPALLRRLSASGALDLKLSGFVCMAELLLLAKVAGASIVEIPMVLDGFQRKGASNMKILRTISEYVKFLIVRFPTWIALWFR